MFHGYVPDTMKTLLPFILSAIFSTSALADLTLVNETQLNGIKSRTTMWIKGDKTRADNDTTSSVIMNTTTGDMITLVHEQKMIIKTNTKELEALSAKSTNSAKITVNASTVTATGKMETVDGHECEIYLVKNLDTVVKMWVAKNYPGQEKIRTELKVLTKMSSEGNKQPDVPGIALKTEFEQQGMKFITTLVSIKSGPVDEAHFTIPADYKAP